MDTIRAFIALPSSTDIQQRMAAIQSELQAAQADVKWDLSDKFHITMKFLGDIEQSTLEVLSSAIARTVQQFPVFDIIFDSLGAFPHLHSPRVIWIGTKFCQSVLDLHSAVEQVCFEFGFRKEGRPFHAHCTFGRVKGTRNLPRLTEAIKTVTFEPMQLRCSEVHLMKSNLRQSGSIYTTVKTFPL
jgi:RNA 2',3'-cyclic 3'-phosphodiesterase